MLVGVYGSDQNHGGRVVGVVGEHLGWNGLMMDVGGYYGFAGFMY